MEVPLATVDQKRRKWWRDALINLCFIAGWYVDIVCWLSNSSIDIGLVRLRAWATLVVPMSRVVACLEGLVATRQAVGALAA